MKNVIIKMICDTKKVSHPGLLISFYGTFIFIVFYYIAAKVYPGGNFINYNERGFSWRYNFWCNLFNEVALNGEINHARPWAIASRIDLLLTLIIFYLAIPRYLKLFTYQRIVIYICGSLSVITLAFMLATYHDEAIVLAGLFGLLALMMILAGLYQTGYYIHYTWGIVSVLLAIANHCIYTTGLWIIHLPVIQKIIFLVFLSWFGFVSIYLYWRHQFTTY